MREISLQTTAEDYSFFGQQVPSLYFWIGITPPDRDPQKAAFNHSPLFYLDEAGMITGVRALLALTTEYLAKVALMAEPPAQGGARRSTPGRPILFELARLAAVVALPLLAVIALLLFDAARRDIAHATDEARTVADETAARTERFLGDFRATLEAIAQRPQVRAMDPEHCDPALPTLRELYPRAGNIIVVDIEGWILCGAKPPPGGERMRIVDMELHRAVDARRRFRLSAAVDRQDQQDVGCHGRAGRCSGNDGSIVGAVGMAIDLRNLQPFGAFDEQGHRRRNHRAPRRRGRALGRSPEQWIGKDVSRRAGDCRDAGAERRNAARQGSRPAGSAVGIPPGAGTNWIAYGSVDAAPQSIPRTRVRS